MGLKFTSLKHLGELFEWATANNFEPYFEAKANASADIVINGLAHAMARPEMQLQSTKAPECPIHHKPLKPSQYGGWFCSHKIGNDFCPISIDKNGVWKGVTT